MASKKVLISIFGGLTMVAGLLAASGPAAAQSGSLMRTHLGGAPPLGVPAGTVAGEGNVWWALNGSTLEIHGTFLRLASPATVARIHMGPLTGVMGNAIFDLSVRKTADGMSGLITGSVSLNPEQIQALRNGRLYVQLNSEGTENGHLQGWLLQ